ncbi:MAG TPA: hypothetical protein VLV83_01485 [Acidobacteriota bacterium]|nr:hypothetical protein [Acidobacteriota bacterium]
MARWDDAGRGLRERAEARLRQRAGRMPLSQRLDASLALLWGGTLGAMGLFVLALVVVAELGQWSAEPGARPLADARILENLRNSSKKPFVDAVWQAGEERLYVAQQDWTLHRYDPDTRLWSTERPLEAADPGGGSPLALLDPGCGTMADPLSPLSRLGLAGPEAALLASSREDCPDPTAVYALSEDGALLRRQSAGPPSSLWTSPWRVIMADNAFLGASGAPVEQDSLTTAAVSPDGRLLALGSSDGLGLYDTRARRWIDNSALHQALGEKSITHLAFWRGRLWIGNRRGLTPLDPADDPPVPAVEERLNGRVMDLDVEPASDPDGRGAQEALWLLQERRCLSGASVPAEAPQENPEPQDAPAFPDQSAGQCLRLLRLDAPDQPPVVLIDERSRFPGLNLDDLHFVRQRDDLLVAAGRAGIYAYDLNRRNWKGLFPRAVTSLLPMPGESGFYFGYTGGVGVESGGEVSTWPLGEDAEIIALRFGEGAEVLALAGNGSLFSFDGAEAPVTLRESTRSALAADGSARGLMAGLSSGSAIPFQDAVGLRDAVFLAGDGGALLHNVVTRQYVDIPADKVPDWMRTPGRRFFASDRYLYVLSPRYAGRSIAYILPRYRIEEGDLESYLEPVTLRAPVGPVRDWDGRGIGLIDAAGNALRLHPGGRERFNGLPQPGLDGLPLLDAAALDSRLTLLTSAGLQTYDTENRSWSGFIDPPLDSPARQAAYYNDQLLVLHADGRLGRTTSTAHVIGDQRGFAMDDQELSDVHQQGRLLYLAGDGAVEAYDPLLRRIIARWRPGRGGEVEVLGLSDNRPVSLGRGDVHIGNERLETGPGRVLSATLENGRLWMLSEQQGRRFVRSQSPAAEASGVPPSCYFRRPSAGGEVGRLLDAARLPNGALAVATDAGIRFYHPAVRSWTDPPQALRDFRARRVTAVGRQLLAWTGSEAPIRLAIVSQDALLWPDSCSPGSAALRPSASIEWREAVDLALSPDGNQAAWLLADQSVEELSGGQIRTRLDPRSGVRGLGSQVTREQSPSDANPTAQSAGIPSWDQLAGIYDRTQAPVPYLIFAETAGSQPVPSGGASRSERASPRQPASPGLQAGTGRLWIYRLDRRSWIAVELSGLVDESMAHLNLVRDAASEIVTVRSDGGAIYRGVLQPLAPDRRAASVLPLRLLYPASRPLSQAAPPLDVQGSGNLWTFVLPQGVFHYNALQRRWLPTALRLPARDPTLQLRRVGQRLVAVADSGDTWYVADDGSDTPLSWTRRQGPGALTELESPPALVTDWLRWDRAGDRFMLTTPDGVQDLPASQSLNSAGTRYFFEEVQALLAPDAQTLYAANEFGLWMHPQPQLGLGDSGVIFRSVTLGETVSSHGSRLVGSSLTFDAASGQIQATQASADGSPSVGDGPSGAGAGKTMTLGGVSRGVALGPLVLSPASTGGGLTLGTSQGAALVQERGFPWDAVRRQVAYDDSGNLILLTDNGPQPAGGFDPVNRPTERRPDPVLVSDDTWTWRRTGSSAIEIRTADGRLVQHGSSPGGRGYSLDADRLTDAAYHQGHLWLLSSAGLHKATLPSAGLRWQNVEDSNLSQVQRLRRQRTPGGPALLAYFDDSLLQFRGGQWQEPSSAVLAGLLIDTPRLRFQRPPARTTGSTSQGQDSRTGIIKFLRIESASGAAEWVAFSWQRGRFPFDVVTSMAAHNGRLLLGTLAGLQIYSGYADGGIEAIDHIYSLGISPAQGLRVEHITVPPDQPSQALAQGGDFCLSLPSGGTPRTCTHPPPGASLRADTPLWRWTASGGRVQGRYKLSPAPGTRPRPGSTPNSGSGSPSSARQGNDDDSGSGAGPGRNGASQVSNAAPSAPAGPRVTIRSGRLPHDRLVDLASFNATSFFLWDDGRVSLHPRGGGRLQDMRLYGGFPVPPRGFALVHEQTAEDPPPVPTGLYLRLSDGGALHWQAASQSWRPLDANLADQLDRLLRTRPIFRQGRLRLVEAQGGNRTARSAAAGSSAGPFRFEHRTPQGSWEPLVWRNGRLQIDIWNDFVPYGGQLWAATPAGLAAFRRGPQAVRLDPASFRLIRGPLDADGNLLPVSDMQSDGAALMLRCNSDSRQLFLANLDQLADPRVFTPLEGNDPFAQQTLVQTDYWQWRREGRRDGSPGVLRFTYKGRESDLSAGRFAFDTLTSLAFFRPGQIETATQSAGWLRYPRRHDSATQPPNGAREGDTGPTPDLGPFHPANLIRPRETAFDPARIQRLHLGRALDQPALCLIDAEGRSWRLLPEAEPTQVASCPAHLAQDSLWTYSLTPSGLQAETDAVPFPVQRRLAAGRFHDAIALTPLRALAPTAVTSPSASSSGALPGLDLPPNSRYLILTPAGILVLDAQFNSTQLITSDWTRYQSLKEALSRTRVSQPASLPGLPPDFNLIRTLTTPTHTYVLGRSEVLERPNPKP